MIAYVDAYRARFGVGPICRTLKASLDCGFITARAYWQAKRRASSTMRARHETLARDIHMIHALRHEPGCTQARLAEILHADKAAIARRTKNLEAKGFLVRQDDPNDRRSQLLYPTEKAEAMKASKAEIEASFYEYLTSVLTDDESETFAALLNKLYTASKIESRAGFPHFIQAQRK